MRTVRAGAAGGVETSCRRGRFVSFDPGEQISREGDPTEDSISSRRGFVKIARQSFGDEVVLNYLSKGQYFGEAALLGGADMTRNKRRAACSAIDHVDLIALDGRQIDELVDGYSDFAGS